jgi:hypothetical protein
VIGAAVMVAKIATAEIEDTKSEKNPHPAALGKLGGAKGVVRALLPAAGCFAGWVSREGGPDPAPEKRHAEAAKRLNHRWRAAQNSTDRRLIDTNRCPRFV